MSRRLIIRAVAQRELDDAVAWYHAREVGLDKRFLQEVQKTMCRILENPGQFPRWGKLKRRAVIEVFPFTLHFREEGNDIVLLAVFNASRDPSQLLQRR